MKKHVIRILIVFILSILVLSNFCYADLLPIEPTNGTRVNRPKPINTTNNDPETKELKTSTAIAGASLIVVAGVAALIMKNINSKNSIEKNDKKDEQE